MTGLLSVTHDLGSSLTASWDGISLLTYVYDAPTVPSECPKPYFHPLRTLDGVVVTGFRPYDHRWHHGLAMTLSHLSGQNFWGGPTYVPGRGYVQLDNVGRMEHRDFEHLALDHDALSFTERLDWTTAAGDRWVDERRTVRLHSVSPDAGTWTLDLTTVLHNVSGRTLEVGSPTTAGRPAAGYGGLFWRGPRSWAHGRIHAAGAPEPADGSGVADALMGRSADWLAYSGQHDGVDGGSTLVFFARTDTSAAPTRWFVRDEPYAVVSPSPAFHQEVAIPPDASMRLAHRLVVADRPWGREEIEARVGGLAS